MPEFEISRLLDTNTVAARNVRCSGSCRHRSAEECASATHLVFPYRGVYMRHVGSDQAVADANHVLFFNADEGYQVSHPIEGGDASLSLGLSEPILRELAPSSLLNDRGKLGFRRQHRRIDPRAQALVALLRHSLENGTIEPLEAEGLLLTLVSRSLGPRTSHEPRATHTRRRLADRVKVLLGERSFPALDTGGNRRGDRRLTGLSNAGVPTGRRHSTISLSPAAAARASVGPDSAIRQFVCAGRGAGLFQPQPFRCSFPAGLWPIADGLQAIRPARLEITKDFDSGRRREMVS